MSMGARFIAPTGWDTWLLSPTPGPNATPWSDKSGPYRKDMD